MMTANLKHIAFLNFFTFLILAFFFICGCTCDDSDDDDEHSVDIDDDDDDDDDDNDDNDDDDDNDDNDDNDDTTNPGEALCKSFETAPGDIGYKWTNRILANLEDVATYWFDVEYDQDVLYTLRTIRMDGETSYSTYMTRYDGAEWVEWQLADASSQYVHIDKLAIDSHGGVWTTFTDFNFAYSSKMFNLARWEDGILVEILPVLNNDLLGVNQLFVLPDDRFTFHYYSTYYTVVEQLSDGQWTGYYFEIFPHTELAPDPNGILRLAGMPGFGTLVWYVAGTASSGFTTGVAGWAPAELLDDMSANSKAAIDSAGNAYFTAYLDDYRIWLGKYDGLTTEFTPWREETISSRDFQGCVGHGVDDQNRPFITLPSGNLRPNGNCFIYKSDIGIHSEFMGSIGEMSSVIQYDQASGSNGRVATIMSVKEIISHDPSEIAWHVAVAYREPID